MPSKPNADNASPIIDEDKVYSEIFPRLEKLSDGGDETALYDALIQIDIFGRNFNQEEVRVPFWVWDKLMLTYESFIRRRVPTQKGAGGNPSKRHASNQIHRWRYITTRRYVEKGCSITKASKQAHEHLKGTPFQGSAAAMTKSYNLVKKAMSDTSSGARFRASSLHSHQLLSGEKNKKG